VIDILVNNAGITRDGLLFRMTEDDWNTVIQTNLTSCFHWTKHLARPMTRARWGRIVNIASVSGIMGNAGQANYSAAKAGMIGLTRPSPASSPPAASRSTPSPPVLSGRIYDRGLRRQPRVVS